MIRKIIDELLPDIKALNFADKVGGIVDVIVQQMKNSDDTGLNEKTYPVYANDQTTCDTSYFMSLVPDSKKKSIIYFEDQGATVTQQSGGRYVVEHNVRLVCWCNLKLINANYADALPLLFKLIDTIPVRMNDIAPVQNIIIELKSQEMRGKGIFSAYTYNDAKHNYWIYPYDYFALNYTVQYQVQKGCISDVVINPSPC